MRPLLLQQRIRIDKSYRDTASYFTLRGLPGSERYSAAAVISLEDGEESDPELLQRLQRRATSFLLADAEQLVVEVPLVDR